MIFTHRVGCDLLYRLALKNKIVFLDWPHSQNDHTYYKVYLRIVVLNKASSIGMIELSLAQFHARLYSARSRVKVLDCIEIFYKLCVTHINQLQAIMLMLEEKKEIYSVKRMYSAN